MRTHMSRLGWVLATIIVLAACGGTPAAPTGTAPPQATTAPQATNDAAEPQATSAPPTAAPAASTDPKILIIGHNSEPPTLNPFSHNAASFQSVTASTIEQLVYFAPNDPEIQPGLAESWTWSDDGATLELTLKEGVTFHNGEPFDAEAAKFSIEQLMSVAPYTSYTGSLGFTGVEVVDATTIRLSFANPNGYGLAILARGSYVVPPKYYQEVGEDGFGQNPVGTGPYQFREWSKGDRVIFDAYPSYWGGTPNLDTIIWRAIPEQAARIAALEAGEVQMITYLAPGSGAQIRNNADLILISNPGLRQFATFFDMRLEHPVADPIVRRALNYAVDKQGLVALFDGDAIPLTGQFLTPAVLGYNPDLDPFDYDPQKAKELLAEAGYPDGFSMTLKYTVGRYPLDREMGEAVAGYLEAVGLTVEQIPLDINEFNRQHTEEPTMGPAWQWGLLTPPDPHITLGLFREGSPFHRYPDNPAIEDLLQRGSRETDPQKREAIYQELLAAWNEDPLGIYLIVPNDLYAASTTVSGFVPRVDQVVDLTTIDLTE
jgi:peptide/nickel transport system substrate-binding protein